MRPTATGRRYPLSPAQHSLWTSCRLRTDGGEYNVAAAYQLRGRVDVPALRTAVGDLVRRHPVLTARFTEAVESPTMEVPPDGAVPLTVHDGQPGGGRTGGGVAPDEVARAAARPFDLERGPLAAVELFPAGPVTSILLLTVHHLVADERSATVLWADLGAFYDRRVTGVPGEPLPDDSFGAHLLRRQDLPEPERRRNLDHWRRALAGAPGDSLLPPDFRVDPGRSRLAGLHRLDLGAEVAEPLRDIARQVRATEFTAVLASFAVTAARFRDTTDVLVATPIGDRPGPELDRTVGFFVRMVPLRTQVDPQDGFAAAVRRTRTALLGALVHRDVPYEQLVRAVAPGQDPRDNPLAPATFQLGTAAPPPAFAGLSLRRLALATRTCRFDLECSLLAAPGGGYTGDLVYDRSRYDPATVASFARAWTEVLHQVVTEPESPVGRLRLADRTAEAAARRIGRGEVRAVDPRPLPLRVAAHSRTAPDAAAVVAGGRTLSYGELDRSARTWAGRLAAAGVDRGDVVGVCLPRSAPMVVAMLAVLDLGAAYLPMDPGHPAARRAEILRDAGARVLLSGPRETGPDLIRTITVDPGGAGGASSADPGPCGGPAPDDVAYVVYTSGSTGRPKGVPVTHRSLANLLDWFADRYALRPGRRCAQLSTPAFDAHVLDLWTTLAAGATVHIGPDAVRSSWPDLAGWLAAERIELAFVPTVLAEQAAARPHEATETVLLTGGDVLGSFPQGTLRLHNLYGPTEATVAVTESTVECSGQTLPTLPTLGRPLWNTEILVADVEGRCVPAGAVGEIRIAGAGVVAGYLGRPDLTARSFVTAPDGRRWYRTGDRGRWRADHRLEFLGRLDRQVQIRGHRVEPAEIEAALSTHDGIQEAAVVPDQDGRALLAYVVPAGGGPPPERRELRAHLRGRLPEYMVPVEFAAVAALPRTASGKLRRDALDPAAVRALAAEQAASEESSSLVPPRTAVETDLVAIWADELDAAPVSVDDTLFDLGADSLSVVRLADRLRERGYPVAAADLLRHGTVSGLAAWLSGAGAEAGGRP
jgi:amino acid adenylation domain-containing protein